MNRVLMILSITVAALAFGTRADAADSAQQPSLLGNMKSAAQQQATQEQKAATDVMHSEKTTAQQTANQEQQKAKALAERQKAAAKSKATEQQKNATDLAAG